VGDVPAQTRQLLTDLARADDETLLALAEQGRRAPRPPAFRGRCLDPAYLTAVATGAWTRADEQELAALVERAEATSLPRVGWRHRRALRTALRCASLSLLTERLACPAWQRRRSELARAWTRAVGPLPTG
jgi:hypothetical protein